MGIKIINNFSEPYLSTSIKEFWGAWHISFSTWLKNYVYIPLGGNRKGNFRWCINLFITFVISGLWHGFYPTFIAWGLLHVFYQILEKFISVIRIRKGAVFTEDNYFNKIIKIVITFLLVNFSWLLFKASTLCDFLCIVKNMFRVPSILYINGVFNSMIDVYDLCVCFVGIFIVFSIDIAKRFVKAVKKYGEGGRWYLELLPRTAIAKFALLISIFAVVCLFGCFDTGVSDFIYRGF